MLENRIVAPEMLDSLSLEEISLALSDSQAPFLADPEDASETICSRRAAVLLPLVKNKASWELLFIRRSVSPRDRHSGQVAFPGGMWEAEDASLTATALREAHEEIGLDPASIEPLGTLPRHRSIAGVAITPLVATLAWPCPLRLQTSEVARVFSIPLRWLADENSFEIVELASTPGRHQSHSVSYREYEGERLWGVSARITLSFLSRLGVRKVSG